MKKEDIKISETSGTDCELSTNVIMSINTKLYKLSISVNETNRNLSKIHKETITNQE